MTLTTNIQKALPTGFYPHTKDVGWNPT